MIFQEPMVSLNPLHTIEKRGSADATASPAARSARAEIVECSERVGIRQAKAGCRITRISCPAVNASG